MGHSVTGGYVYRGALLALVFQGRYFFGDFISGRVWSVRLVFDVTGEATPANLVDHTPELNASGSVGNISAFGIDLQEELYIVRYGSGLILKVVPNPCAYAVTPMTRSFAATGGSDEVTVQTAPLCGWTASHSVPSISVSAPGAGSGNGIVTYSVAPNTSPAERTDLLTVAGRTITITQAGSDSPRPRIDFDADGRADLIWQHSRDGSIALWHMRDTNLVDAELFSPGQVADTNWRIVGAGDVNADGHPDLIWQHQTEGWLSAWLMNGTTLLRGLSLDPPQVPEVHWKVRAVGDLNGDGWPDLVWQHEGEGWVATWLMRGTVRVDGHLLSPSRVADLGWEIVGAADLNSDGHIDLVWQHRTEGWLSAWLMRASTLLDGILLAPGQVSNPSLAHRCNRRFGWRWTPGPHLASRDRGVACGLVDGGTAADRRPAARARPGGRPAVAARRPAPTPVRPSATSSLPPRSSSLIFMFLVGRRRASCCDSESCRYLALGPGAPLCYSWCGAGGVLLRYDPSGEPASQTKGSVNNKVYKIARRRYAVAGERLYEDGDEGERAGGRTPLAARAGDAE